MLQEKLKKFLLTFETLSDIQTCPSMLTLSVMLKLQTFNNHFKLLYKVSFVLFRTCRDVNCMQEKITRENNNTSGKKWMNKFIYMSEKEWEEVKRG